MNNYQPKNAGVIDKNFVYPISNIFSEVVYKLGLTPNLITCITFIIRSVGIYYMYLKQQPSLIFKLYVISWFTDALDGIVARKYDMKSDFGAFLDAFVDVSTMVVTFIVLLLKYYNNNTSEYIILLSIIGISYFIMGIKLNADSDNINNIKPWEKKLACIPVNIQSNSLINAIDPGFIYLVILCGLYYGLFILN